MDTHIDWLSFTLKTQLEPKTAKQLYLDARQKLKEQDNGTEQIFFDGQGYEPATSRSPYRVAIARADNGSRIYGSSHTETILFELTGRGCEPFRKAEGGRAIIGSLHERITRIDIAVDIRSTVTPTDFANARSHDRFRSLGFIRSPTGETVYVGSAKSDRFCRVYRYNPPHPRADLLRVEYVFRRGLARDAALQYASKEDIGKYTAQLGNTFGFNHQSWQPGTETDERLRVPILMRDDADTVYWLYHQVAPAIKRMMETGGFDMAEWLQYVYGTGDAAK